MGGDLALDLRDMGKRPVPAGFQLACNEPVRGIGGVILPEGAVGGVACRFEITQERVADLVTPFTGMCGGGCRCGHGSGTDHAESAADGIVDARRQRRCSAARHCPSSHAQLARDVMLHATVAQRQLPAAAPTTDQTSQQRLAMLGRAMVFAGGTLPETMVRSPEPSPPSRSHHDIGYQR
jgi:hypothetical protein